MGKQSVLIEVNILLNMLKREYVDFVQNNSSVNIKMGLL